MSTGPYGKYVNELNKMLFKSNRVESLDTHKQGIFLYPVTETDFTNIDGDMIWSSRDLEFRWGLKRVIPVDEGE